MTGGRMDEWEGAAGGWMGGMEGSAWRGREWWRLRHITFPQCIKGTGLSVTHTVRLGRGGGDGKERGRRRRRPRERGWGRERQREEERRSLVFLTFHFLFSPFAPSPISDVIQVTYSSQQGSLLPLPLLSFLSRPPLSPLLLSWLAECMNEQASLSPFYCGGRGWQRKPWGRRRAREEETLSDKEEREGRMRGFPWHLSRYTPTADLILYVWSCCHSLSAGTCAGERAEVPSACMVLRNATCTFSAFVWHKNFLSVTLTCFTEALEEGR